MTQHEARLQAIALNACVSFKQGRERSSPFNHNPHLVGILARNFVAGEVPGLVEDEIDQGIDSSLFEALRN
jgi:hypothetical protein